jgi:hypothetical protein
MIEKGKTPWPDSAIELYPQKLALTSPTSGGRSVGVVGSRIQAMEFVLSCLLPVDVYNVSVNSPFSHGLERQFGAHTQSEHIQLQHTSPGVFRSI